MSFETTLKHMIAVFEGGYANNPKDTGGETFQGVARKHNPNWLGWPIIDDAKKTLGGVKRLRKGAHGTNLDDYFKGDENMFNLVADLYRLNYWAPVAKLDAPEPAIEKIFDAGVNVGPKRAIQWAQTIVGAAADGAIGPKTNAAAKIYFSQPGAVDKFLTAFCARQRLYYESITQKNPSQKDFLAGWLSRAAWRPIG